MDKYWALQCQIVIKALIHSKWIVRWAHARLDLQYAYGIHSNNLKNWIGSSGLCAAMSDVYVQNCLLADFDQHNHTPIKN